jgi:hypothetical protein
MYGVVMARSVIVIVFGGRGYESVGVPIANAIGPADM